MNCISKTKCPYLRLLEKVIQARAYTVKGKPCLAVTLGFEDVSGWGTAIPLGKGCSFLSLGGKCEWIFALYCD